jgi:phosphoglycerate dehydrogenase-like enzyme
MIHVHIPRVPSQNVQKHFIGLLDENLSIDWGPDLPSPAEFEILVAGRADEQQLSASPVLKKLIIPFAGVPHDVLQVLTKFPQIEVHNLHHNASATAETALNLLLAAAKQTVPFDRSLRAGDWSPRYQPSETILLHGKTALIIGYGAIGQKIAEVCRAMGMKVLATRKSALELSHPVPGVSLYPAASLLDLLPLSQVVLICTPLTPETAGMIGEPELSLLPKGSILINVGRGPIVEEHALYHALTSGRLAAAGLDVWWIYPDSEQARTCTFPSEFPFHELDNVVLSPHRGGASQESDELRFTRLAHILNQYNRHEPLDNRVDLQKGY